MNYEIGKTYRIRKFTPLMPALDPRKPMRSIKNIKYIRPGIRFKVIDLATKRTIQWIKVETYYLEQPIVGWFNTIALVGQDIAES